MFLLDSMIDQCLMGKSRKKKLTKILYGRGDLLDSTDFGPLGGYSAEVASLRN